MSSTEYNIGLAGDKASSRVLRPPGGGSSGIFEPPLEIKPHARPKYDQQNSSNLNFCMNTVDPNLKVQQLTHEKVDSAPVDQSQAAESFSSADNSPAEASAPAPKQEVNLPNYHHHRSTALW
jgi:hypothetical protein